MPASHISQSPFALLHARRLDMSSPLVIFGSLLVAAFAICGVMESRSAAGIVDEVKVLNQENVVGPLPFDIIAMCKNGRHGASARCHERNGVVTASLVP